MNFKFFLFKKEFIISFIICIILGICILSYLVWYGMNLNWQAEYTMANLKSPSPTVHDTELSSIHKNDVWPALKAGHTFISQNVTNGSVPYSEEFGDTTFDNLKKINPDTIGWIQINNTNINYPVVQTDNNDYYLNHTFLDTHNIPGSIFMDCRNTVNTLNQNTIIYGHGELLDGSMFSSMSKMFKSSWLENAENHIFVFNTEYQNMNWQIFSIYKTEPNTNYLKKDFDSQEQFLDFVDSVKEKSIYDFYTNVISDDKIITLSTCKGNKRVVVHAKLVK